MSKIKKYIFAGIGICIVLFSGLIFLAVTILKSNMVLPEQPVLTAKEAGYFKKLQEIHGCPIVRNVDPEAVIFDASLPKEGHYLLLFDGIPCTDLEKKDSLKIVASQVAHTLHSEILDRTFNYRYKSITIDFQCQLSDNSYMSEIVKYTVDDLGK